MTQPALSIAVLGGGRSEEREVSLRSMDAVIDALHAVSSSAGGGFVARAVPIGSDGSWEVAGERLAPSVGCATLARVVDVVFLALHGGAGENGTVQGLLEETGLCYTGSGVAASALCMDKEVQRVFLASRGLRMAPGRTFSRRTWLAAEPRALAASLQADQQQWGRGWVAKPRRNGSSVGVRLVERHEDLEAAVTAALEVDEDVLVEARVPGIEATCGVLGNRGDGELRTLTPVEIRPHEGRFFDYEEKYSDTGAIELCPPESLSTEVQDRIRVQASLAHRELGCDGYSRSDFIVPEDGDPVFLETNTLPGLTPRSLLPLEAATDGLDFPALCQRIVELALERFQRSPTRRATT